MKLVESRFDKNEQSVESLTARNIVLTKEIADGLGESLPESVDIGADVHLGAYMTEPPAAVSGRTGGSDQIVTLVSLLGEYLPYLPQLANMKVALDTGTLVGELVPQMDERLGVLALRQRRQ